MKKRSIFLVILILFMASSLAQEAIIAAGEDGTGSGGSISFSIGQILYSGGSGASGEVLHGVQIPYEILVDYNSDRFEMMGLSLSTYPNPVRDVLILKLESLVWTDLNYQLYNSEGKIFLSEKLLGTETSIYMSHFAPGVYFLQVNKAKDAAITFKIIKRKGP
jgi:hypothetical protein